MSATRTIDAELAVETWAEPLHSATLAMARTVSVPPRLRARFYDVSREEPRRSHLLGTLPLDLATFAFHGAPLVDTWAPLSMLKSLLFHTIYRPSIPCFMEMNSRETESNNILNHAQHRAIRSQRDTDLDQLIEACEVQMAETRMLKAAAMSLRYPDPLRPR